MAKKRWIFLRGLAREQGHWGGFIDLFRSHFPNDDIQCIDLPGTGLHVDEESPRTISEIYQRVRDEAMMVEHSPVRLMTVSLGSMVAMEWLQKNLSEIEFCVMVNTSTKQSGPFYKRLRWQVWVEFLKILMIQKPRDRERAIVDILMNSAEARETALPIWTKIAVERPVSRNNVLNQLMSAAMYEGLNEAPKSPVLLLSGLGDRFVDPVNSESLQKLWGVAFYRHPWAGHDLPWDDGQWVVSKIQEWLVGLEQSLG